jgi:Xaa-Pro aminopeptidase
MFDYDVLAHAYDAWLNYPSYNLCHDIPYEEYLLRLARARRLMEEHNLDALVITSSTVGWWFTSLREPHEWHDQCLVRSTWFILTHDGDYLYMPPTAAGEHFNTTRRTTWVSEIRAIVERVDPAEQPRAEIWGLWQVPRMFADLGLARARVGFELGDCMTLGMAVNDFLRLRDLLPHAQLVDGSPVIRRLMQIHTPLEIERTRLACEAGVWIHEQTPHILTPGISEREFHRRLAAAFAARYDDQSYVYAPAGAWDIRNPAGDDSVLFHAIATDRVFRPGDTVSRCLSGVTYAGYWGDVDRVWHIGKPPSAVEYWYRVAWECVRAMEATIRPGVQCSDIYAAYARMEQRLGLPARLTGRIGHGLFNTGGISVHPDCHLVLEPGMIVSCEPIFANEWGWFDLEDQFVVTATGCEPLHRRAPETIPVIME